MIQYGVWSTSDKIPHFHKSRSVSLKWISTLLKKLFSVIKLEPLSFNYNQITCVFYLNVFLLKNLNIIVILTFYINENLT